MKKIIPSKNVPRASLQTLKSSEFNFQPEIRYALISAITAFLLYANTLGHSYVLDDAGVITQNEFVKQGMKGIGQIFKTEMWHFENVKLGYYRPLSLVTFAIENQFFPGNAFVSHLGNVILYALTAFFLCLLLMQIFKNFHPLFSLIITLLFIAHPVHTEVVANIKSRDELLAFLNLIIAIYCILRSFSNGKPNYYWILSSFFFFYLALLSKESAMIGFMLVPVILFFEGRSTIRQILFHTVPFIFLILIFQFQKFEVLGSLAGMNGADIVNYPYAESGSKSASMFLLFLWCLKLTLLPYPLCYSYAYDQIPAAIWSSPAVFGSIALIVILLYVVYKTLPTKSPLAFGLLLFGFTLAPALGFVLLRGGIFAERFLYAPVLGFSIVLTWLLLSLTGTNLRSSTINFSALLKARSLAAALFVLFFLYSSLSVSRNRYWHDDFALISHDVQVAKNNCQIHLHYGSKLIEYGIEENDRPKKFEYFQQGTNQLRIALLIYPHLPDAYYQIGQAQQKLALNRDSAIYYYNRAMMENTNYPFSYMGLAGLYENSGEQALASYYYNKAVEVNPFFTQAILQRSIHQKKTGLDVKEFPSANISDPTKSAVNGKDFNFYYNAGRAFGQSGDFVNAVNYLNKSVELNPGSVDALINLSVALGMTKEYNKSIRALERALLLDPNNTTALTNIAIIYRHTGNNEKAMEFQKRLDLIKR